MFKHFSLSVFNKVLVIRAGIHKMLFRIADREVSDLTAPVCLCLFGRQIVFEILE